MNRKLTIIICIAILLVAAGLVTIIFLSEPAAQRVTATKQSAMLVEVTPTERGTYRPVLVGSGTVIPEKEVILSPRVSGEIVFLSEKFTPGGYVEKGELLLEIDPADYEAALLEAQSQLHEAEANLEMELGRRDVAEKDYELLGRDLSPQNQALVLREPQLATARAQVEAARAAVRRAELDLERTRVMAPFSAHILSREVNVGSQVSTGERLGRLVGMEIYWVEAAIPVSHLPWINFPEENNPDGAAVRIRNRSAWPDGTFREGRVHRLIAALEDRTRMARLLVTVKDPLARKNESGNLPPIIIGSFLEVRIEGKQLEDVLRLERDYLRQNDTVWVKKDGKLEIREADVLLKDHKYAYVRSGLEEGEQIVTTNLATVLEGASLRLEGEGE